MNTRDTIEKSIFKGNNTKKIKLKNEDESDSSNQENLSSQKYTYESINELNNQHSIKAEDSKGKNLNGIIPSDSDIQTPSVINNEDAFTAALTAGSDPQPLPYPVPFPGDKVGALEVSNITDFLPASNFNWNDLWVPVSLFSLGSAAAYGISNAASAKDSNSSTTTTTIQPPLTAPTSYFDNSQSGGNTGTGTLSTANTTRDSTPGLKIGALPSIAKTAVLYVDGTIVPATYDPVTEALTPVTPLTVGAHKIGYGYTDNNGNTTASSPTFTLHEEAILPPTPTTTPTDTSPITNVPTPSIMIGSLPTGVSGADLYVDSAIVPSHYDPVTGTLTATNPLSSGEHTLGFGYTNAAGERSSSSPTILIDIDLTAPTAPSHPPAETTTITNDTTPSITIGALPAGTSGAGLYVDGLLAPSVYDAATGTLTPFTPLTQGSHTLGYGYTDAAGNTSASSPTVTVAIDTTAPTAPTTAPTEPSASTNDTTPGITIGALTAGSSGAGLYVDGVLVPSIYDAATGTLSPISPLPPGPHTLGFGYTDAAGNTSASSPTVTDTVDTTPPASPATAPTAAAATNDTTPSVTIGALPADASAATLYVDGVAVPATYDPATGTLTPNSPLSQGAHSISFGYSDAAGNSSAPSPAASTNINTTAPTAPTTAPTEPSASTNDTTPGITIGALPAGTSGAGLYVDGVLVPSVYDPATGILSPLHPLPPGSHTLGYGYTDAAGNTSASSPTVTVAIDTTAPTAPTTAPSEPSASTNDTTPGITIGALPAGASGAGLYVDGVLVSSVYDPATGILSPLHPLPPGSHTLGYGYTDAAGNTSASSPTVTVAIDTTAPTAPTTAPSEPSASTNDTTPSITIGALPAGSSGAGLYVDGMLVPSAYDPATGTLSPISPLPPGPHTLGYGYTDAAGNTSASSPTVTATVDTTPPASPTAAPTAATATNDTTPSVTIGALPADASAAILYVDGSAVPATYDPATGTLTPNSPLSQGAHSISFGYSDAAGNSSAPSPAVSTTVDTTPPTEPTLTLAFDSGISANDNITNVATVNVTGIEVNSTWHYNIDGGAWIAGTGSSFALQDGTHTYAVQETDASGNTTAVSAAVSYTLDTAISVPHLALVSDSGTSASDGVTDVSAVTVSGLETGATWKYQVDGSAWITGSGTSFNLSAGTHSYSVEQTDAAGNTSAPSTTVSYTFDNLAATPSLALALDSGSSATDGTTDANTVNVSGVENGAMWQYQVDGGAWITGSNSSFNLSPGTHSYTVMQTDAAGNTSAVSSAVSYTLDNHVATPLLALTNDSGVNSSDGITNANNVQVSGIETDATWQYKVDSGAWVTGSGSTFTLNSGAHAYTVEQTDAAGNISTPSTAAHYTLDTSADAPMMSLATDSGASDADDITNVNTVNVSGIEMGATWQYKVDSGVWMAGSSTSFMLSAGTHTYDVEQTDVAGNSSATSTAVSYTLDTIAATPSLLLANDNGASNTDGVTNTPTVNVTGLETPTTWHYSVDGGTWVTGLGSSFSLSAGTHAYAVEQTDVAGNTSAASTPVNFTLDSSAAAPTLTLATDSGTSGSDGITHIASVNVNDLKPGATWQYKVDTGAWTDGTGTSFSLSTGMHAYFVQQTDVAGNTSVSSTAVSYTLDTSAATPTLALVSDSGTSSTDGITNAHMVNVSALEAGATWQYKVDSGTWTTGTGSSFALTAGAHTYIIEQTDVAGNTSAASTALSFTLDSSASAPTIGLAIDSGSSSVDGITNENVANVSGLETGAAWRYQVDGSNWITGSSTSFTLTSGAHNYSVDQIDIAGNTSAASASVNLTLDTTVTTPTLTLLTDSGASSTDGITNVNVVNVSDIEPGASWQYKVDSGAWTTGTGSSFTLSSGTHAYIVQQTDAAGNSSAESAAVDFTLDTSSTTPTLSLATDSGSSTSDGITDASTVNVNVNGLGAGATWQYQVDGGTWVAGTGTSFSLTSGSHSYIVEQTDIAGNSSAASTAVSFTLDTAASAPTMALATDSGSSATDGITDINIVHLSGLETGATWQYQVDGGVWTTGTGTSFTLSSGAHTYAVQQSDAAGNTSAPSSTANYTLDTSAVAPTMSLLTDSGISSTDGITNIGTVLIADLEPNASWRYELDGGSWITGTGTSFELTSGTHTYVAEQIDIAGNASGLSLATTYTYRLDTTAIAPTNAPTSYTDYVGSITSGDSTAATTDSTMPGIHIGSLPADIIDAILFVDGSQVAATYDSTIGTLTPDASLAPGLHTFGYGYIDTAGNTSVSSPTLSVTIDTTAPIAPISAPLSYADTTGSITSPTSTSATTDEINPDLNIGALPANAVNAVLYVDGVLTPSVYNSATGNLSATSPLTLSQGLHTLGYGYSDAAGNIGASSPTLSLTVDTTPPLAPSATPTQYADNVGSITSLLSSATTTDDTTPGLHIGSLPADASVAILYVDGVQVAANYDSAAGTLTPTQTLSQGLHTLSYGYADAAGNMGLPSPSLSITMDTLAPTPPTTAPTTYIDNIGSVTNNTSSASTTDDTLPSLNIGALPTDATDAALYVDGVRVPAVYSAISGSLTPTNPLDEGVHTLGYGYLDAAGNVSTSSPTMSITIDNSALNLLSETKDDIASNANLVLNYNQSVSAIAGKNITIVDDLGVTFETIAVDNSSKVSISGATVTINPSNDFVVGRSYHALIDEGSFVGANGVYSNAIGSTAGVFDWTFKPTDPVTTIQYSGTGVDTSNGINATELAGLTLTGTVSGASLASVTAMSIAKITLRSSDGTSIFDVPTSDLPSIDPTTHQWTLANNNNWTGLLVSGKSYSALIQLSSTIAGTTTVSTSSSMMSLVDTVAPSTPSAPLSYADDVGMFTSNASAAMTTDDTTPGLVIGNLPADVDHVVLYVDGVPVAATYDNGSNTLTPTTAITTGSHNLSYAYVDAAGNTGAASAPLMLTVDITPPSALASTPLHYADNVGSITSTSTNNSSTDDTTPSLIIGSFPVDVSHAVLLVDGQRVAATYDSAAGTLTPTSPLTNGAHTLSYAYSDAAGNTSTPGGTLSITINNIAPAAPATAPTSYVDNIGSITSSASTASTTDDTKPGLLIGSLPSGVVDATLYVDGQSVAATYDSVNGTLTPTSPLAIGVHSLSYGYSDAAGNASSPSPTLTLTVDTTAPYTPILDLLSDTGSSGSDGITSASTATISGLEAAGTWHYQVDGGAWVSGTGTSFTLSSGPHSYIVQQFDSAGNSSAPSAAYSYTLVTAAAVPATALAFDTGTNTTDGITSMSHVNVTGLETGATWQYKVDSGAWTTGSGSAFSLTAGAHTYSVQQTDVAGNTSAASTAVSYTLDTSAAAPALALATDSGSSASDGITNVSTVNVSGIESGATWQYKVDSGSWVTGVGNSFNLSSGVHTYAVMQTDAAGNTSVTSTPVNYTLDSSAVSPTLALATDSGANTSDGITNVSTVNVSGIETGAAWQYKIDAGTWTTGSGTSFSLTAGAHTYSVQQTDAAGNTSTASTASTAVSYTLSTSTPTPNLSLMTDSGSLSTDGISKDSTVNVNGLSTNAVWHYQVDGGAWITGSVSSFTLTAGAHTYSVQQTDVAGNTSAASTAVSYTLDTSAATPALALATDSGSSTSDGITSASTVNVSGLETGATWQYKVDSGAWTTGSGSSFALTAGAHTYSVQQTDVAGNTSAASTAVSYTLDTSAATPALALATDSGSSASDGITSVSTVNVSGLETGATWQYKVDSGAWTTGSGSAFALTAGAHTYSVQQTDVAGNTSAASTAVSYTLDTSAATPALALATDSGSSTSDGITSASTVNVSGLETGATWQYKVDSGAWTTGSGSSFALTAGAHTYSVQQTDVAGNTSAASTAVSYTLDTSAVSPSLALATDGGASASDGITNASTVNVIGIEAGASWKYQVDGGTLLTGTGSTFNLSAGTHTYAVQQTDAAGNSSAVSTAVSFQLDTTAPTVTSALTGNLYDNGTGITTSTPVYTASATDSGSGNVTYSLAGAGLDNALFNINSNTGVVTFKATELYSATKDNGANNVYDLTVVATDLAGNTTSSAVALTMATNYINLSSVSSGVAGFVLNGQCANDQSGKSVSSAGDVNGDGLVDLIVSANLFDPTAGTDAGRSYVVFGKTDNTAINLSAVASGSGGFIIDGQCAGDQSGNSVSSAGDLNGDGLADLIIGAPQSDPAGGSNAGRSYVVYGKTNTSAVNLSDIAAGTGGFVINGQTASDQSGASVSSAGDINGDGLADLIVGAPYNTPGAGAAGRSYIIFGNTSNAAINLSAVAAGTGGYAINGQNANDNAGFAVSVAGDVNGDGLADVIVGSWPGDPAGGTDAGRAYVVFGKTDGTAINLSAVIAGTGGFVMNGECAHDNTARNVSSAGDVNGDGLADVFIGGYSPSNGARTGYGYLVFGKAGTAAVDLTSLAVGNGGGFIINGQCANDQVGYSVSSAGDINGDGLSDLIISAVNASASTGSFAGRTYVVYGKTGIAPIELSAIANNVGGFVINGQAAVDYSGNAVSSAGDINGDGLADLLVTASYSDPSTGSNAGRTYVIFGSSANSFSAGTAVDQVGTAGNDTLTSTGAQTILGGLGNDTLTASGADVLYGGAGNDTFVVGNSTISALASNFGSGGNTAQLSRIDGGTGINTLQLSTGASLDLTRISNSSLGTEVDGTTGSRISNIERIDMGTDTAANTLTLKVQDVNDMTPMNWINTSTAGWANVGAGTALTTVVQKHQLVVDGTGLDNLYFNDWSNWTKTGSQVTGTISGSSQTYDVYNSVNGNAQVFVNTTIAAVTSAPVINLSSVGANVAGFVLNGQCVTDQSGWSVSSAGDVNGDGLVDLIVGTPLFDAPAGTDAGRSYVVFGKTDNSAINLSAVASGSGGFIINGQCAGDQGGNFVSSAGDLNGDGLADLIIGATLSDPAGGTNAGRSYVVYGKTSSSAVNLSDIAVSTGGFVINGQVAGDQSGFAVSSAGDINGDGLTDLIVSAPFSASGAATAGRSYVIFGSTNNAAINLSTIAAGTGGYIINGQNANDNAGLSVSGAGDVNGDGLADVLVGAWNGDPAGGTDAGRSFVVFGKTDNTAINLSAVIAGTGGFVMNGECANDKSGNSVSSAGDVNGDGLADVFVGTDSVNNGTRTGYGYLVFGKTGTAGVDLTSLAAGNGGGFIIKGQCFNDQVGFSVSSAGDVNGDGLSDLIISANNASTSTAANAGRTYVVYGKTGVAPIELSAVANNVGGFVLNGQCASDYSGNAVSGAGDINGDGLADLLVGAVRYDNSGTDVGRTYVIFGSSSNVFSAGTAVDQVGTAGNDTLTSWGAQTILGGLGNDTLIASSADVLYGGAGNDTFVVGTSTITALSSNFGSGGNTVQLSRIDGGTGINTIRLSAGASLDLTTISNSSLGTEVDGTTGSRISNIERIDLGTDTAANTLKLAVKDVLDMSGVNEFNTGNGWTNVAAGTAFSATVSRHQLVVDGTSVDIVQGSGWTDTAMQVSSSISGSARNYEVYNSTSGYAQLLVDTTINRSGIVV